mgnify:CR=1 FL=1
MAWKKYFKDANLSPISGEKVPNFAKRNYSSYLPDVYTGHPNRIQRYFQYDQMDSDSEINAALDILAEFSTQKNQNTTTRVYSHNVFDQLADQATNYRQIYYFSQSDTKRKLLR